MIALASIIVAVKLVASTSSLPFIRAYQEGRKPPYPYISYQVINQHQEKDEHAIETRKYIEESDKILHTSFKKEETTLSLSFLGNDAKTVWPYASSAFDYLNSAEGKESIESESGLFAKIISENVQDRTTYLETSWEVRLGFDLILCRYATKEKGVNIIQTVQLRNEKTEETINVHK